MRTKLIVKDERSILYLLELDVEGERVYKIGITSRDNVEDRCIEIIHSYFKGHREFCWLKPKRYRKVDDAYEKEQWLLSYLSEYRYVPEKKFGGSTELVKLDLDVLVELYEKVYNGEDIEDREWNKCECGCEKKFIVEGIEMCGNKCEVKDDVEEITFDL